MRQPILRLLISTITLLLVASVTYAVPPTIEEALDSLDWYIANRQTFVDRKFNKADSLKSLLDIEFNAEKRIAILEEIGMTYRSCNIDSARKYMHEGIQLAKQTNNKKALWHMQATYSSLLPISGIIRESISMYESLPPDSMSQTEKAHYYMEGNRLFNYVLSFYSQQEYINIYYDKVITITDSLLANLDKNSMDYHLYKGEQNFFTGNNSLALAELSEIIDNVPLQDNYYARAASMIAYYHIINNDPDKALYYYILSAISDIASGTREYTSLQYVGEKMYEKGEIGRAFNYLTIALDDASKSGSFIRTVESAKTMPMIYDTISRRNHRIINWLVATLIFLSLVIIACIILIFHYKKAVISQDQALTFNQNRIINQHNILTKAITTISDEIAKIEEYNRLVSRKMKAKAYLDLHDYATSGKVLADARALFIERFDETFNSAIPDFQSKLNNLLADDKQLPVTENLSPEIRIMALIRLGVNDTKDISQLLGLSVNTIYTYRNKVKGRAIDKENFEKNLKKIF